MKRLTAILAITASLTACSVEPPLTERDIILGVSQAFCERLYECAELDGFEPQGGEVEYCIDHNEVHLCGDTDCEATTTDEREALLVQCIEEMAVQECTSVLFLGAVPESCEGLL